MLLSRLQLQLQKGNKIKKSIIITDYEQLQHDVCGVDWDAVFESATDIETMWSRFVEILTELTDECSSSKNILTVSSKPCIDNGIPRMLRHQKSLW